MITYGSYLPKHENLGKNTALICTMDTLVALIAGFIIVPAVFATLGSENVGKAAASPSRPSRACSSTWRAARFSACCSICCSCSPR